MSANTCRSAARTAWIGVRSSGWARNASVISGSNSSPRTTSSLVGKYRKNVLGDTSAASAIWSTVVSA
jgi:hypothetical protein